MTISRLSGVTSNILLSNSLQTVTLESSNISVGTYAKGYINDDVISTITSSQGVFVLVYNEFLEHVQTRRFIMTSTAPFGSKDVDFIDFMGTLEPRKYFALVGNLRIGRSVQVDEFLKNYLGSVLWEGIWEHYHAIHTGNPTLGDISFSAFGSSELGITHESASLTDTANLCINIGDYDRFCDTGYGLDVIDLSDESYSTSYTDVNIPFNNAYKAMYLAFRYKNAVNSDSIQVVKTMSGNSIQTSTISINSGSLAKTAGMNIAIESDLQSLHVRFRNIDVIHGSAYKANTKATSTYNSCISKKGKGLSVFDTTYSMSGYDFENTNHLMNFSQKTNVFSTLNTSESVDGVSMDSVVINGITQGDFIEVIPTKDYFLGFFCKNVTANNTNVTIKVEAFDDAYNVVQTISYVNQTSQNILSLGDFSQPNNDIIYQEYYVLSTKQSLNDITNSEYLLSGVHGNISTGGLSADTNNITDLAVLTPQVKFLRITFETNNAIEVISPVCDEVRFSITNYSRYLGTITES